MDAAKRILIMQWEYAKGGGASAQTVTELAGELLRHGHDVEVVAQAPRGRPDVAVPPGLRLTLTRAPGLALAGAHSRAWGQLAFLAGVLLRTPRYVRSKDCVITLESPPGLGLVGVLLRRVSRCRIRHLCWVLDLYDDQFLALHVPDRYAGLRRVFRALDHMALARASEVVVVGECMRDYLRRQGIRNTISVIPVWQDAGRIHPSDGSAVRERLGLGGGPCLLYSGHATYRHPLTPLIEAARQLPALTLVIAGTGESFEAARALVERYQLHNVRVEPPVPAHELNTLLSSGDLHAVVLDPRATGTCVPSKAYAAMAVAKPLLFLGDDRSQVARDVRAGDCGAVVDPAKLSALVEVLRDWISDPDGWAKRGRAGYAFFVRFREKRYACSEWLHHL
ncbi:MAG: glycosyltransferase family 4 protein [Candidatus Dormibacter sp.]